MRNKCLLILLVFAIWGAKAQSLKGIWFAGCNLRIDKNAGIDEFKIDSIYGVEGSILDFTSGDTFVIKSIGEEPRRGTYKIIKDTLQLNVEDFYWKAVVKNEELTLSLIDSSDYSLELFYKKLSPSNIPENKILTAEQIKGSNWNSTFEKGSARVHFSDIVQPDFSNKPQAYVSNFFETSAITELGNYQLDSYKGHLFLYLFGRTTFAERVIHIGDYADGTYAGEFFECFGAMDTQILFQEAQWTQTEMLDEHGLIEKEAALNGRYQFKILQDTRGESSEIVTSLIAYLELNKDATFTMEAFLSENIDEVALLRKLEKAGTWELHPSGHFIRLFTEDDQELFLTIQKGKNKLELFLNVNPWPEEEEFDTVLKFLKH